MKIRYIILALSFFLFSSGLAQEGKTQKEIETKNEFFKKLQQYINTQSAIGTKEMLSQARVQYPDAVLTWYLSAKFALDAKDYMQAYEYYLQAKTVSDDPDIDYLALDILTELGEYEQLIQVYASLVENYPYDSQLYRQYLNTLLQMKKYNDYATLVEKIMQQPMTSMKFKSHIFGNVSRFIREGKVQNFNKEQWESMRKFLR